jgi:dihydrofolate reductase
MSAGSPQIALIYARAANGVIGRDGSMPWHLPEDLAHFRQLTEGHPVIMGRKTWDSLPPRFRPLPGRRNIVLTRQARWQAEGAERADGLPQALALCEGAGQVWVIGGAQIYAQAQALAHRVEVTEIHQAFEGDAHAPALGPQWHEVKRSEGVSKTGLNYSFVSLERR